MPRFRRSLWIPLVLLVLGGAVAGVLLKSSTERALGRAEALRFRRMLVTQAGENTYRFFYATNRRLAQSDGPLEDRFTAEREPVLHWGRFDSEIEPALGIGMLVDPTDWFRNEEIRLRDVHALGEKEFVRELRKQVMASSAKSLLVNINGFRERFPSALRKTAFLAHVLDIDTPILVFDWPGNQGSNPVGYRRARGIAQESGADLARTLELLLRAVRPEKLSILANSMGAEVVVSAFHDLYAKAEHADSGAEFDDVVLTAPDVGHAQFREVSKEEIGALARNLTIYVSSNDRALLMSRVLNRERRLGESTVDPSNPEQLQEAAHALELTESAPGLVTLVDVTPVNRTRNFHNFSLETPEFFDDLYLRLSTEDPPQTRQQYRVRTPRGAEYWVLTRGR